MIGEAFGSAAGANPISAALNLGNSIIERIWPDPEQQAKAKQALDELHQRGELAEMAAAAGLDQQQIEVNKLEAANPSLFVSGWRPALGWICDIAIAVYFIPRFVIGMVFWSKLAWDAQGVLPPMPEMGVSDILGLIATLLGSSWLRYKEKQQGIARI
jgi:hypothetical protein